MREVLTFKNDVCEAALKEAYNYYHQDYNSMQSREKYYYLESLKYFRILQKAYKGKNIAQLAEDNNISRSTLNEQLKRTQGKIEMFLKLKELGRL